MAPRVSGARVLVTGAHGFIGRAVVRRLAEDGAAEIRCPYRPGSRPAPDLPGTHVAADLRDVDAVARLTAGADLVVHLAARSGGIAFQQDGHVDVFTENTALTRAVLAASARAGVRRLFLASSAVVYRGDGHLDERAPTLGPADGDVSGYAWSKLTDEVLGGWYTGDGLEVVAGRFGNVYGPGGPPSTVVHALVARALAAPPGATLLVWGDGTAVRSFLHVDDAARAVLTIVERGRAGEVYNVDSGQPFTIAELAGLVRDAIDPQLSVEFDHSKPSGLARRVPDPAKLLRLGFVPFVQLGPGIVATVEAFRADKAP